MTTDAPHQGRWPAPVPPEHPEDLLTAYLDGDATVDEIAVVERHLGACGPCRQALAAETTVRILVRTLPLVLPPPEFYAKVLAHGPRARARAPRRTGFAVANLVAAAAVWLGVVAVARVTGAQTVRPAIGDLVSAHASVLSSPLALGGGTGGADDSARSSAPRTLARNRYLGSVTVGGRQQLLYRDGERMLSMFVQPGELDVSALPVDAEPVAVNAMPAWRVAAADVDVILVQRPGVVIVLVVPHGSEEQTLAQEADAEVPEPSLGARIDAAARGLLDAFGLG